MNKVIKLHCPYCNKEFSTKKLNKHIERIHSNEKEIFLSCKQCSEKVSYLDRHGLCCSKSCSYKLQNKSSLIIIPASNQYSFINIDKEKDKLLKGSLYNCPHCDSKTNNFSKFKRHIFQKHTEKTGKCFHCGEKNDTGSPYCSRSCANTRTFSKESNLKKAKTNLRINNLNKDTLDIKIISKLNIKQKNRYTYPNLNYINSKSNINIECSNHGEFIQLYYSHLNGGTCPKCLLIERENKKEIAKKRKQKRSIKNRLLNKDNLIEQKRLKKLNLLKNKRGNKFYYPNFIYNGSNEYIDVVCSNNHSYKQRFNNHLRGKGCSECAREEKLQKVFVSEENFILRAKKTHGDKYDYSKTIFKRMREKIIIGCKECKKDFKQIADIHLRGGGCPNCAVSGFKFDKPGILYYLKIERYGLIAYKIGITNHSVEKRFGGKQMEFITILRLTHYESGEYTYNMEQTILKRHKASKWTGRDMLENGNTELFDRDVLNLDS